ncbi:hypothetical protein ACOMHN_061434 [Nucella lapillus]
MEPELVKGDRGGRILTYRGFRYQQKRISGAEMEWRCWRRETCVAGLQSNVFAVDNENAHIRVFRTVNLHNHPEETDQINRALIRERMRAEVQEDPTRPSRRIYDAVLANVQRQGGGDIEVPPFESVRSAVERTRSALVPPIPTTVEEVNIDGPWAETWLRDMFLLRNRASSSTPQTKTYDSSKGVKLYIWTRHSVCAPGLMYSFSPFWAMSTDL